MTRIWTSGRLLLRRFAPGDLEELASMVADEEQMRFYERPKTRAEASAWIVQALACYERHGFGPWRIELRATGEFAGYCGPRPLLLDGAAETEIGWHTKKTMWGTGIASEAAR